VHKSLGIIGGMGVQATAAFYQMLNRLQNVTVEQEYIDTIVCSMPSTPDRTLFITGKSEDSPLPSLLKSAKILESAEVACIAVPCVTSHFFYDDLARAVSVPVINVLDEVASLLAAQGYTRAGVLATDGTLQSGLFQNTLEKHNMACVVPSDAVQTEVMNLIYDLKRGETRASAMVEKLAAHLQDNNAQCVILGCTELCIHLNDLPDGCVNVMEVLASAALRRVGSI